MSVLLAHLTPPPFAPLLSPVADAGAPQENGEAQPGHRSAVGQPVVSDMAH